MHAIQVSLRLNSSAIPGIQQLYNHHIMGITLSSNQFTPAEIRRLNYCQLFLNTTTFLSDCTHITGTCLDQSKLIGQPSLYSSTSSGTHIYEERPADHKWQLWKKANRLWSTSDGAMLESMRPWLDILSRQQQQYQAYGYRPYSRPEVEVWVHAGNKYIRCIPSNYNGTFMETDVHREWATLPHDMHPVDAQHNSPNCWQVLSSGCRRIPTRPLKVATFEHFIQSLPPLEEELLRLFDTSTDPFTIREVSDCSVWTNSQGPSDGPLVPI